MHEWKKHDKSTAFLPIWFCANCGSKKYELDKPPADALGWELLDCEALAIRRVHES